MPSLIMSLDLTNIPVLQSTDKHILQGLFYSLLSDRPELSAAVHQGIPLTSRYTYKLFTFSNLRSETNVRSGSLVYIGPGTLEFRSPDMTLCETVANAVQRRGCLRLGVNRVKISSLCIYEKTFFTESLKIRMETPVTVHHTLENRYTRYYHPNEPEFKELVSDNFARKYASCYGEMPEEGIKVYPQMVKPEDLIVARFKGTIIKGYLGSYILQGRPEYLKFLYESGLGDRNSQGFGMFQAE